MATIDKYSNVPHVPDTSMPYLYHGITSMEHDPHMGVVLPPWEELRQIVLVPAALRDSRVNLHQIDALAGDDRYLFARPVMTEGWPLTRSSICLAWATHEVGIEGGRLHDALDTFQAIANAAGCLDLDGQEVQGDAVLVGKVTQALRAWAKVITLGFDQTRDLIKALTVLDGAWEHLHPWILALREELWVLRAGSSCSVGDVIPPPEGVAPLVQLTSFLKDMMNARALEGPLATALMRLPKAVPARSRQATLDPSSLLEKYFGQWQLPESWWNLACWAAFDKRSVSQCEVLLAGEYPISEVTWVWLPELEQWLTPRELDAMVGTRLNRGRPRYLASTPGVPLTVL